MPDKRQFTDTEIDQQYNDWLNAQDFPVVDDSDVRDEVDKELEILRNMTVEEYTLWRKWNSIKDKFPGTTRNTLFGSQNQPINTETIRILTRVEAMMWRPEKLDDYLKLEPELYYVKDDSLIRAVDIWGKERFEEYTNPDPVAEDWRYLRHFVSSAEYASPVGRSLNFLVRDKVSKRYLGVICISSDLMDLTSRDKKIGWTRDQRTNSGKLKNTANASSVIPIQPLGTNYVGGKLLALLCISKDVQDIWQQKYRDVLVGVTTTSLYGAQKGPSQYSSLKHWKSMGHSAGSVPYQLSRINEKLIRSWMRIRHSRKYWELFAAKDRNGAPMKRDATTKSYQFCYNKLGFKPDEYTSNHKRGVYFARLYENTYEFLRSEISKKDLKPIPGLTTDELVDLWKTKYAKKRLDSLQKKGAVSKETLFSKDIIGLSWDETKSRYLKDVGR